jgi:protein TonB
MKKILTICFTFLAVHISVQSQVTRSESESDDIFTVVEQMPEFPGGDNALNDFIIKNLKYPEEAKKQNIQGKVWIGFIVDKEGNVLEIEALRGIGGGCDEEAVRVVALMPKWKPGKQSGKPVVVKYRLPINFTLH